MYPLLRTLSLPFPIVFSESIGVRRCSRGGNRDVSSQLRWKDDDQVSFIHKQLSGKFQADW